jgi:hypothetical protein
MAFSNRWMWIYILGYYTYSSYKFRQLCLVLKNGIRNLEKLPFPVGVVKPAVGHKSISVVLVRTEGGPW